jgi:hypothetical protein
VLGLCPGVGWHAEEEVVKYPPAGEVQFEDRWQAVWACPPKHRQMERRVVPGGHLWINSRTAGIPLDKSFVDDWKEGERHH